MSGGRIRCVDDKRRTAARATWDQDLRTVGRCGHTVLIGSRSATKARDFAKELGGNAERNDINRRALLES